MNCDGVRGLLSAYVDGELSAGELLRVEQHLRRCHACADEVDSLRQTIALVASLDEVEVPASFHAQLHERLVALGPPVASAKRTKATPPSQRQIRKWAMPAAAAAAVLAIGLTSLQQVKDMGQGGSGSLVTVLFPKDMAPKSGQLTLGPGPGSMSDNQTPPDSSGNDQPNSTPPKNEPEPPGGTNPNPTVNQPPGTGPSVPENGGHVANADTGGDTGQTTVKPLTSYKVKLTATAGNSARQSLLGLSSAQELHDGTIRITVSAADREKTMTAIRATAGLTIVGEPQAETYDYADQLARAKETLEHWQSAVLRLQRQVESVQDASDRQAAQASLDEARQQVTYAEDSIRHLEAEAGKAVFEIRLQAAAQ